MFFYASKIAWMILSPESFYLLLLIASVILLTMRVQIFVAWIFFALAMGVTIFPIGAWLLQPLENAYPRAQLPAHVDGILVLGGGLGAKSLVLRGVDAPEPSIVRLIAAAELARRYPAAKLVFTGGNGEAVNAFKTDAFAARAIFTQLGLAPSRAIYEDRSRNTFENFSFSQAMVRPRKGEVWVLVTSAFHMSRAMGVSRKAGWPMLPWPSDYRTTPSLSLFHFSLTENLTVLDLAAHEWLGLLAYRLSGKAA